jgi:hypothetical protein
LFYRRASFFVEIGGDRLVDINEIFEPIMEPKMRELKCFGPQGLGFQRAWANSSPGNSNTPEVEDCSLLIYSNSSTADGAITAHSAQFLPSLSDSDAIIIGTLTYTLVAVLAYCNKSETAICISALSDIFYCDPKRLAKLYADLASVPCVAHTYSRMLQVDLNPFYRQRAFENDSSSLETSKYQQYREAEMLRTREELVNVVRTLYLTLHIHNYKVRVDSNPPHSILGPASKIEQRTFFVEAEVIASRN